MIHIRLSNDGIPTMPLKKPQKEALAKVRHKLESGFYANEETDCPTCASKDGTVISEKDRYGLPMRVVCCNTCGLVRTNPRMTQNSYNDFYQNHYRQLYGGKAQADATFFNNQKIHGQEIQFLINSKVHDKPIREVWEIGCGAGGILASFKSEGISTKGCDLGEDYLQYGRQEANLILINGGICDIPETPAPDLIIYSHVLEHILDIPAELNTIHKKLADGGLLYIEVPSLRNIHNSLFYQGDLLRYIQNAHTYHFTLKSLRNLLKTSGFELVYGDEYIKAIFRKITPNIDTRTTPLKNEHNSTLRYLKRIEYTRHLFKLKPAYLKAEYKKWRRTKNCNK